jgi:tape measure domain-containing protein
MDGGEQTMSNTVDNRAVHLGFENQQFENGVKTSVESLDKLKKSLDLTEQAKSLQNLSNAGKTVNLSGIADNIQNLSNRFSVFGIIGMTVLQNLTNSAIEFGKKLWQSLVAPAKKGFSEYEIQMNAIQTIMANTSSKGTTLQQVNDILNEMNTYADKTIYNFAEMAKNMGTFTAAGVDLRTSADAIKGIANLAAVSGSNSQQAATAMYQLSQALSSGTVKLMDWNSVVNAGMGGQVFQDALKETARVHGIAIDDMIKQEGSFRETLQRGWLTSTVLTETLQKFTGDLNDEQLKAMGYTEEQIAGIIKLGITANDAATKVKTLSQLKQTLQEGLQSGWAQSWQIIIGDFEEAKSFFTYLSDIFGALIQRSSESRNAILQGWKDFGGRGLAIQAIKNVFDSVLSVMKAIGDAWKSIFPSGPAGKTIYNITKAIKEFTEYLKPNLITVQRLRDIFRGLFAILDIGKMAVEAIFDSFGKFDTSGIKPLVGDLLQFLKILSFQIIRTRDLIKTNDTFGKILEKVKVYFLSLKDSVSDFGDKVKFVFDQIKVLIEEVKNTFKGFLDNFQNALNFNKIDASGATSFLDNLKNRFAPLELLFKGVTFIIGALISFLKKAAPILLQLGSWMGKILGQLGTAIMNAVSTLDFTNIFDTLNAGFLGAFILAITKFVKSGTGTMDSLSGMFKGISGILDGVRTSLEAWQQNLKSKTLLNIAIAIGILAASLLVLSLIDSKKLTSSIVAITALFTDLMASIRLLSAGGGGGGVSALSGSAGLATALIALSVSLLLISAAVSVLSKIDPDELRNGLVALGAITTGLVVFMRTVGTNAKSFAGAAISLIILAVGLEIITNVVKRLGAIDVASLQKGLIAVGVVLGELAVFTQLVGKGGGISGGLGIIALAAGILLISVAVEKFGKMDIGVLKQGLITIGAVLTEVAIFTKLVGNGMNLIATAIGMSILGAAMIILTEAIIKLGNLSWEQIAKGMAGMAATLLAIVVAVKLMPKSMIITAVGLAIVAGAIAILADALVKMSSMSWKKIAKGLVLLAGALLIISIAMYAMTGTIAGATALLVVSAALSILTPILKTLGSMSLSEIAIALGTLAAAFVILGVAGTLLTPTVPTLLGLGVAIALIGTAVMLVGAGLLAFSMGLAALAVSGVAGATAFVGIVGILLGIIPMLITAIVNGIILFGNLIIQAAPVIGKAIIVLIATLCGIIIASVPTLVKALTVLLNGLWTLIRGQVPKAVDTVLFVIGEMLKSLAGKVPDFVQSGFDILLAYLEGIRDNIGEVVIVVGEIITEFLDALAKKIPDIIQSGVNLMISFIEGITKAIKDPTNRARMGTAIKDLADAIIKGLTDGLFAGINGIVNAVGKISSSIISALKTLLGIASASKVTTKMGMYLSIGLAKGMLKRINQVKDAAQEVAKRTLDSMNEAVASVNDSVYNEINISPVISPVVDLTDVITSGKNIKRYLTGNGLQVPAHMDNVIRAAAGMNNQNGSGGVVNPVGSTINFYQNNTSPKALSSYEIYRETRNQLLMLKGLVISQ